MRLRITHALIRCLTARWDKDGRYLNKRLTDQNCSTLARDSLPVSANSPRAIACMNKPQIWHHGLVARYAGAFWSAEGGVDADY